MEHGVRGFQTYTAKSVRHENNGSKGKERNEAGDAEGEYVRVLTLFLFGKKKTCAKRKNNHRLTRMIKIKNANLK